MFMKTGMYYNIATIPYYNFVRSGYNHITTGKIRSIGGLGYYWAASATSKEWSVTGRGAYSLGIYEPESYPSNGPTARWYSLPLRRLSSGGGRLGSDD